MASIDGGDLHVLVAVGDCTDIGGSDGSRQISLGGKHDLAQSRRHAARGEGEIRATARYDARLEAWTATGMLAAMVLAAGVLAAGVLADWAEVGGAAWMEVWVDGGLYGGLALARQPLL